MWLAKGSPTFIYIYIYMHETCQRGQQKDLLLSKCLLAITYRTYVSIKTHALLYRGTPVEVKVRILTPNRILVK